jgi:ABC-type sugar transport system ATPase subunit
MGSAAPLLQVRGLAKHYGGVAALNGVDLTATAGEVHAIVGANGAGKSTLMNILAGVVTPSEGEILIDGVVQPALTPLRSQQLGIATVHQELSLVSQLSVARNVYLGREPTGRFGLVDEDRMVADAQRLFQTNHLELDPSALVEDLSVAQQQLVELAHALSGSSRALILDEPTAVLSGSEQNNLFGIIAELKSNGLLILYVSHRLEEILTVADRVTVLRDGLKVTTRPVAGLTMEELVTLMIGESGIFGEPGHSPERDTVSRVGGTPIRIDYRRGDENGSFEVRQGEIVGLGGLVGSGRTTLARALCGLKRPDTEVAVTLDGNEHVFASPHAAMHAGIAYVTEDRKRDGLFANLSVLKNTSAAALSLFSAAGILKPAQERRSVGELLKRLRLVARTPEMPVEQLSGGNQQKVVFGRALMRSPRLLICDEPTRGVDVGAKREIYNLLRELAGRDVAILVISSEIEELIALTHRIVVMRDRRIVAVLDTHEVNEAQVLLIASGGLVKGRQAAE